tara:strand:+ start:424 stop:1332 length:909 start_codon:yes stop_codon:yes gene_type:complete
MKILLVANKTYRGLPDSLLWYFFEPLGLLGHDVYLYDTVDRNIMDPNFSEVVDDFKPELIFCILSGDPSLAPHEPWKEIKKITEQKNIKTFNWFCDDTWRFEKFSSQVCKHFTACSTPEPMFIDRYKSIGYNNILLGNWHANSNWFSNVSFENKKYDIAFVGTPNSHREQFFKESETNIEYLFGLSQAKMFESFCNMKIGVNLSVNANDPLKGTQMKQRMFEVTAGGGLLMTQYHKGIEQFYEINKEIVTFESPIEFKEKTNYLLNNKQVLQSIAKNGYDRFIKEHDSRIRLANILEQIQMI